MQLKKIITLCLLIPTVLISAQSPILPSPVSFEELGGNITLKEISLNSKTLTGTIYQFLVQEFDARFSQNIQDKIEKINLEFNKINSEHQDFYSINVDEKITLNYTTEQSCFYALNSLLQLIEKDENNNLAIKRCKIEDYPNFQWRGLHLDVSRHFFSVEEIKKFIDLMAYYKFNTFHWHLTDDQGWRIEIKKYPKLTEIGAWRDSTVNKHYSTKPRTYTKQKYGGFYTQNQIKEIIKYAQNKFITIVPEIELPGHSRAALAAYPEFSCTGLQQNVPGLWGIFDDIFCSKQETIAFLKDILGEVCELFPSEYIHIGGDEAPKTRWKACSNCQKVIRENKLKDEHELQSYFIKEIDYYLTSKGKKLIGWDEILEGGISPNASIMSWRGMEGGIEAVKQGHTVVMSPGSHCYFDHYQSESAYEPLAIGGFTPLDKVYAFNPIPNGITNEQEKLIIGAQGNLWTEYIPNFKQLEYMAYPRAIALAQVLWCYNKPKYDEFEKTLSTYHFPFLKSKNVNFSTAINYPQLKLSKLNDGIKAQIFVPNDAISELANYSFHRSNYPKIKNFNINVDSIKYNFQLHAGLGMPITFQTPPNPKYAFNKDLTLVDGVIGRKPWNGKEWLGFDTSNIVFTLNLEETSSISSITLSLLEDQGSWIYLPTKIECKTSNDLKKWETSTLTSISEKNIFTFRKKAKYIRFEITTLNKIPSGKDGEGHKPWTFIDEILLEK